MPELRFGRSVYAGAIPEMPIEHFSTSSSARETDRNREISSSGGFKAGNGIFVEVPDKALANVVARAFASNEVNLCPMIPIKGQTTRLLK
jgi:hypothetical protein